MSSAWLNQTTIWMQGIQAAGWSGWLIFICLYAILVLLFVPGSILGLGAGAIYGFWVGLMLALISNAVSMFLSILVTRYFLRDWAARYMARHPITATLETAVKREGWRIISLMHLSPLMPFSLINYAFGLTSISMADFFLATVVGAIPTTSVYVYVGSLAGNLAKAGPGMGQHHHLQWALQIVGLIATVAVTIAITRAASQALKKRLPGEENQA